MGLAKPPCCHDAGGLLHHRFSFSLYALRRRWESSFLRRFPSDHSARPLAGIPPSGARTFSRVLQAAHRATVWPTQQCKSVAHRCRRQWHNTSVRHDKPRTTLCSTIGSSMGNVVSRDTTALRTPPSTRCVPASSPRRDVGIFMHRQPNSKQTARTVLCTSAENKKGTRPLRTDPLKQVIVKPIYSASVSSSFFSEGSGVTSISTPRVSAADFMDREIRRRSRSISMTLT